MPPISRSTFAFHVCMRDGWKLGFVVDGASVAAPDAPPIALSSRILLAAVPDACADSGVTSGGLPDSPVKYPVFDWLIITAYAPRTASLPSLVGFQITPTRGWKSLPFFVIWLTPDPICSSDEVVVSNMTSLLSASVGDGR